MTDAEILKLFAQSNGRAIECAEKSYGKLLYRVALSVLSDPRDAEECVADTYHAAWLSLCGKDVKNLQDVNLKAYLLRVLRNRAIDLKRGQKREKRGDGAEILPIDELAEILPPPDSVESEAESKQLSKILSDWLRTLTPGKRAAFVLRYYYDMPLKAVAKRLGFTESKTANLLMRLRADLKAVLMKENYYE